MTAGRTKLNTQQPIISKVKHQDPLQHVRVKPAWLMALFTLRSQNHMTRDCPLNKQSRVHCIVLKLC